jgi:hypothetical protein
MREQRKKIWIDRFQTQFCLRIAIYFSLYVVAVWAVIAIQLNLDDLAQRLGPTPSIFARLVTWLSVVVVAAAFTYDTVKYTHRIVGPLYRFRKTILAITAGEEVRLISLRKGDFLTDMRDEFNEMLKALEQRGAVTLKNSAAKAEQNQPVPV